MNKLNLTLAAALLASALVPAKAEKIAITGATVHTVSAKGTMKNATVLIDGTKIVDVVVGAAAPAGYRAIDAKGKVVTPGFMEPYGTLGIAEVTLSGGMFDADPQSAKYTAGLDISTAADRDSVVIPVARMDGITRAASAPNVTEGIFGGLGMLVQLGDKGDMVTRKRAFMVVDMTELGGAKAGGSRAAAWVDLRAALREAAEPTYEALAGEPMLTKVDRDALGMVARGEVPLVIRANSAAEIREVLNLKASHPLLRLILADAREGWRLADRIAAAKLPVIVDPMLNLPEAFESRAATMANAGRLSKAGVTVALTTNWGDNPEQNPGALSQLAGLAVANGMTWDDALAGVTAVPAKLFGLADYGSLEAGKAADVVIWSGDPFEVMETPEAVFINGAAVPMENRQTKLARRYNPAQGNDTHPQFRR